MAFQGTGRLGLILLLLRVDCIGTVANLFLFSDLSTIARFIEKKVIMVEFLHDVNF